MKDSFINSEIYYQKNDINYSHNIEQFSNKNYIVPLSYNNIDTTNLNVVLIHDQVYDYNKFFQFVNLESYPIVYNCNSSLIDLHNLLKEKFLNINRVSFIFHDAGINKLKDFINNEPLFTYDDLTDNVDKYSNNLQFIIDLVKEFNIKNLDYLACNTLQYDNWNKYYDIIRKKTNVIIGASNNLTGNIKYGDWVLENTNEDVRNIYFTENIIEYQYTLATTTLSQNGGTYYFRQVTSTSLIEYSSDNINWTQISNANWPLQITNSSPSSNNILTVLFNTDITLSSSIGTNGYFIIGSQYITINGNNKIVTINGITEYPGLIQNGTGSNNGYTNIIIQDLGVTSNNSRLRSNEGGWIGQSFFAYGINSGIISVTNCYSTGSILDEQGGIFGINTGQSSSGGTIIVSNCYSTGIIRGGGGGIFGSSAGFISLVTITVTNCYSTGSIQTGGGIFAVGAGYLLSGTITATNCYSTGTIGTYGGGIFGSSAGSNSYPSGTITATNCYSTGNIQSQAGGIFGSSAGSNSSGTITATNCYTIGIITTAGNGIYGSSKSSNCSNTYCIYVGGCTTDLTSSYTTQTANTWIDNNATITIQNNGTIPNNPSKWIDYSSTTNVPWLLSSFNAIIYIPNTQELAAGTSGTSLAGLFSPGYTYIIYNPVTSITIDGTTGVLTFPSTLSSGTYTINVLVGKINNNVYSAYNTNIYILTVTGTISITQNYIDNASFPIHIPSNTIVNFLENVTMEGGANKYFIIDGNNVTINGNNKIVTINGITEYPGLFQNGTDQNNGYTNIIINDLGIVSNNSTLPNEGGWIGQSYFAYGISSGTISVTNCYSTGTIGNGGGGIFGGYTRQSSTGGTITVTNCYSTGTFIQDGGGIFGRNVGESSSGGSIIVTNCYSTGTIGTYGGGIIGLYAVNSTSGTIIVTNCYSTGNIGTYGGGIFGSNTGNSSPLATITVSNCYTIGATITTGNGIYGSSKSPNCTNTFCISVNDIIQPANIWIDDNANKTIKNNDTTPSKWIDYSSATNVPWLLSSFNTPFYTSNPQNLTYGTSGTSSSGLFSPGYTYIIYNQVTSITIDGTTGVLTFPSTLSPDTYTINVLVGKINDNVYSSYNTNIYILNVTIETINITQNYIDTSQFPIHIPSNTIVNFLENVTIEGGANKYFIIDGNNIKINGNNKVVTINGITDYPGLFQNGTDQNNGYTNIIINDLGIVSNNSTLASGGGWIGQSYFAYGISSGTISVTNCYSTGTISINAGGIFGRNVGESSIDGTITVTNCYSTGSINGGGIFGSYAGESSLGLTIISSNCYSIGSIGSEAGGIFGSYAGELSSGGNIISYNCYSIGTIGSDAGGIFGKFTELLSGTVAEESTVKDSEPSNFNETIKDYAPSNLEESYIKDYEPSTLAGSYVRRLSSVGTITSSYCYNTGTIGTDAGGIFGSNTGKSAKRETITSENCYTIGNIGTNAGGIYGRYTGNESSETTLIITATNCYTIGAIGTTGNGIYGSNKSSNYGTSEYCIFVGGSTDDLTPTIPQTANTWIDDNANITIENSGTIPDNPSRWIDYTK